MASECSTGSCKTDTDSCGSSSCGSSGDCCKACNTACGGDPIACATAMWSCGFFTAMKEVQVDILKSKIQKAWGQKMDKAADAVLEAMGVQWQSMLAQVKAKGDLQSKLRTLWNEPK